MSIGVKVSRINSFRIDREPKVRVTILSLKRRPIEHQGRLRQNPIEMLNLIEAILHRQPADA